MRQKVSFSKKSAIKVSNANDQPVLRGFICNWIRLDQVLGIFAPLVPQDMKQMIFRAASNAFLTSVKLILSENQTKCDSTVKRERGENKKYVAKNLNLGAVLWLAMEIAAIAIQPARCTKNENKNKNAVSEKA